LDQAEYLMAQTYQIIITLLIVIENRVILY